ncbi:MAG: cysteine hydrolase [Actinobacteria bacterium]|nr:cysteine hydrolase [Actinomycetota bacterium]
MENKKIKIKGRYWSLNRKPDGTIDPKLFGYRYEDLELNFDETALLVVDVYGKGYNNEDPLPESPTFGTAELFLIEKEIINKKIKPALDMAREKNLKIIYIENRFEPYLVDENSEYGKYTKRFWGLSVKEYFSGDGGLLQYSEIVAPRENDFIIQKRFYGAFTNTELDYLLKNIKVKNLISVGFTADICLFFTLYEAWTHNYKVVLLRDATLAFEPTKEHTRNLLKTKHSVEFIEKFIGHTVTTKEFIEGCRNL